LNSKSRSIAAGCVGLSLVIGAAARGEIVSVSGQASSQVTQLRNGEVNHTQSDINGFPIPTPTPPAISNAQIDGLSLDGVVTSSGQCTAVADDSRTSTPTLPFANNDLGLDLGGFSTDGVTSYIVDGHAQQTRVIRFSRSEVSFPTIGDATVRSNLSIAGALVVVSTSPNPDLTGVELSVEFTVVQSRPGSEPTTRLTGTGKLTGGPNGQLTFTGTGVVIPFFFPVLDVLAIVPSLQDQPFAFLKAVAFPANVFSYTYPVAPDQQFELTVSFTSQVKVPTNDVGAVAVFGLPQEALGEIMSRVRNDDSGVRAQEAIASIVDTTGQTGGGIGLPFFTVCGALGVESLALTACATLLGAWKRRTVVRRRA